MRRSGIPSRLTCQFLASLFVCLALFGLPVRAAAQAAPVELDISEEVIYCSLAEVNTGPVNVKRILGEGTELNFLWEIIIEEEADYWVNSEIGHINFTRRVVPDIVSRQWLLEDKNSGIARRTTSIDNAAEFLTSLQLFPAIDRSLIEPETRYRIRIKLYIHEGKMGTSWWNEMLRFGKTVGTGTFQLP